VTIARSCGTETSGWPSAEMISTGRTSRAISGATGDAAVEATS
jgi:hypothetical protein